MSISKKLNSLRIRFALGFGILFTFFLAAAFIYIYISFDRFATEDYTLRLKDRALSTYKLLMEVSAIDSSLLTEIDRNTPSSIAPAQRVTVYEDSIIIYSNADSGQFAYDPVFFSTIRTDGELFTNIGNEMVYGLYEEKNANHYYIIATGDDKFGKRRLQFLKWTMIAVYCTGIIIGWAVTYFFVKRIIRPLEVLNVNMQNINYNNLDSRLPMTGQGEEVDNLSLNFNQMLARLEQSFNFQRDFVHYASHELRTPLAAMVSVTESSLSDTLNEQQFHVVLQQLLNQQKNLTDITNSLLLLSGSKNNPNGMEYPMIRLDEMIFRSVEITKNLFPEANIDVNLEGELHNENSLLIRANEPLMLMVFNNLLKNGIQYSGNEQVSILIAIRENEKIMKFVNAGKDFALFEKERIFTPFYRASNSDKVKGHGLGLALVKQIVQLHNGTIEYSYENGNNVFTITFV
ncbi:MAG: ATP-binding protein [Chitinophagaceae bacterium]